MLPLEGVATKAAPVVPLILLTSPDDTASPPTVTLPKEESKLKVTFDSAATVVKLKLLNFRVAVVFDKPLLETSDILNDAPASKITE